MALEYWQLQMTEDKLLKIIDQLEKRVDSLEKELKQSKNVVINVDSLKPDRSNQQPPIIL